MFFPGMWQLPRDPSFCCIYRVPNYLRDVNPEAYTPQLVLIGPLHHSLKSQARKSLVLGDMTYTKPMGYLNMEELKKIYLVAFALRVEGEKTIDEIKRMIEEEEDIIRASYSESTNWIKSPEFVEMVLHDSVFIIEYMLRLTGVQEIFGDPFLAMPYLAETVLCDLMLLENQLPYFILEMLFDPILPGIWGNQCRLRELIITYFGFKDKIGNYSEFRHFTDLYRCVYVETLPMRKCDEGKGKLMQHMYNADRLDSGGVKFEAVGKDLSLNVTLENGCLKMSCLEIADESEMILRNIMALEQCHFRSSPHVCNYVVFLDSLIDTKKDVDLLVEKGIIKNSLGEPVLVARMVNKLGIGIYQRDSYYSDIAVKVNAYSSNPFNRSLAVLKRVYFGDLWTGSATIAAIFLLVMALIQTWASVVQVKQNTTVASIIQVKQNAS